MVKFSAYVDYEYALIEGSLIIYDHYLTIHKWELDFDPKEVEID